MPQIKRRLFAVTVLVAMSISGPALHAQPLDSLLANADVAAGERLSQRCAMCHSFEKDGANKMGPNLWNIIGHQSASKPGFTYSGALKQMKHTTWTYDMLNVFLANPRSHAPGNKMPFAGITNEKQRADLIAWMRTLSDQPEPLPKSDK